MNENSERNRALVESVLLPTLFLTVALLGGVRVAAETGALVFVAPPLVTLILAVMLLALFVRGGAVRPGRWLAGEHTVLTNVSHALTLAALFFASAQSFNSVLPERGLPRWVFSLFFLWALWQHQFAPFDARRLLRSLAALFGTAFVLKHLVLASLYAPGGGWLKRVAGLALEGFSPSALDATAYAPATGYVSFFTLALYVLALALLPPAPGGERETTATADDILGAYAELPPAERARVRESLLNEEDERALTPAREQERGRL